jgi:hypothetical protein
MGDIWEAAKAGDLNEVKRLVGQDPGLLDADDGSGWTPLMKASNKGHLEVVRWLVHKGAAIDEQSGNGYTGLSLASTNGYTPVARLLVEKGADPSLACGYDWSPLMKASIQGHLEVVRLLLSLPSVRATIIGYDRFGSTVMCRACYWGRGEVGRALLQSGADPTITDKSGSTPLAIAKQAPDRDCISVEARRECVAALEVSICLPFSLPSMTPVLISWLRRGNGCLGVMAGVGAGLPPVEGPAGGGCGFELRGAAGGGGEDARRGQASARGGSAGGAEGSCGGRGGGGAAGRVDCGGRKREGEEDEGGPAGACRALAEARGVRGADGDDGVTQRGFGVWVGEGIGSSSSHVVHASSAC